jgi:hypothetical protein
VKEILVEALARAWALKAWAKEVLTGVWA